MKNNYIEDSRIVFIPYSFNQFFVLPKLFTIFPLFHYIENVHGTFFWQIQKPCLNHPSHIILKLLK